MTGEYRLLMLRSRVQKVLDTLRSGRKSQRMLRHTSTEGLQMAPVREGIPVTVSMVS